MAKAKKGKQKAGEESEVKAQTPQSKVTVAPGPALVTQFPVIQSSQTVTHPHVTQPHGNPQHVTRLQEVAEEEEADNYGGLDDIAEVEEWGEEVGGQKEDTWGTPRIQTNSKDGWGSAASTGWGAQHTPASGGTPKVAHKKADAGWGAGEASAAVNNDWGGGNNNDRVRWGNHRDSGHRDSGGGGGGQWEEEDYSDEDEGWNDPQPAFGPSAQTGWMNWGEEARKLTSKVTFSTAHNPAHNGTAGTRNLVSLQQRSQIVNSLLNRPNQNNQHPAAPPTGQPRGWNPQLNAGHRQQQQQLQQLQQEHALQQQRQQELAFQQYQHQQHQHQQHPHQQHLQQQRQQPYQQHEQHPYQQHEQHPYQQREQHPYQQHEQQPYQQHQHQQREQQPHQQHQQQQSGGKKNKKNKKQKKEESQHEAGGADTWGGLQEEDGWGDMNDRRVHFSPRVGFVVDTFRPQQASTHDMRPKSMLSYEMRPKSLSSYEMPSKTLSYARQGTDTSINIRPVRNQMQDYANVRFIESKGVALAPVQRALFSTTRPAKSRFHWLFPPDKDERVASLLAWIQAVSYDLASFGLHKFLQSRERGALIVNADYRPTKSPNEPAFDWLTYDQLQLTMDQILQESVALYDPAVQVIVFVFLPSQSGNSMAIWRRKVAVPNNLRLTYQVQIKQAMAALKKEYPVHVEELPGDEPISPISPLVENPRRNGKKKSSWWKRLFTIDW